MTGDLLTALFAGVILGFTVYDKIRGGVPRLTPRKHVQHGLIVFLIGVGFGGLNVLATRVDSLLLGWTASTGVIGCLTYAGLHKSKGPRRSRKSTT